MALAGWFAFAGATTSALAAAPDLPELGLDGAGYAAGPQPLWTTMADGPWLSGNADPTCSMSVRSQATLVDPTGEIYVAGLASASRRFFVLKFSAEGELLWQRTFATDSSSASLVRFFSRSSGEPRLGFLLPDHLGYSVTTLSSDGAEVWTSTLRSEVESRPYVARSAVFSDDGQVYVVGNRNYGGGFVARHAGAGQVDWVVYEGGFSLGSVALAGDGGIVVMGSGVDYPAIAKYDPRGERSWMRELITPEGEVMSASDFQLDTSGEIFLAGGLCKPNLCRPAIAALGAAGEWLWTRVPEVEQGAEQMFRFVAAGNGRVHGLLERSGSTTHFVDIVSYAQSGLWLGSQTLGPFSSLTSAAPRVDSKGWLRFTGGIYSDESQGYLLAALSPAGALTYVNYRPVGFAATGGCDLAEGPGQRIVVVGRGFRYADTDLFVGLFDRSGASIWNRREPDLQSPNDSPSLRIGPPRKSPAAHRAADGSYWVVGKSQRGQMNQSQPMGWHFTPTGELLGVVAPFGQTGYNQWATRAVPLPDSGMAMGGVTNAGYGLPFIASFSSDETETMSNIDAAANHGSTEALFRAASGDFLAVENSLSTGEWSTELVRISASGELLDRINVDPPGLAPYDSVMAEEETVWTAGPIFGQGQSGLDCAVAGASVADGQIWSQSFGDPDMADYCSAIDARGGRIVVGATILDNAVIKSFSVDGSVQWTVDDLVSAGEAWRLVDEVVLDGAGNLYLSGSTHDTYRHRLTKLSPAGVPLWDLPPDLLGGGALSFALGATGDVFALHEPTNGPLSLYRLTAAGEVSWETSLQLPYKTVTATPDGHLILTGSTFNGHSYDLLVSVFDVADFLFADGFESGDVTGWSGGESLSD